MSDSQRFYLIIPVYLLFSAPVGTLWEWKRSVMTPNPPHKAKDWASSPCIWKRAGGWVRGHFGGLCVCGLHVVPWGQIKAHDSAFGDPHHHRPPSSLVLSAQMLIKDLLAGQVQTSSQETVLSTSETGKAKEEQREL